MVRSRRGGSHSAKPVKNTWVERVTRGHEAEGSRELSRTQRGLQQGVLIQTGMQGTRIEH